MTKDTASPRFRHRGHALRRGRISLTGHAYLITTVTHGRKPLFLDFDRGCIAARALDFPRADKALQSLCWVVMPDHVHWLIMAGGNKSVSEIMRSFKTYVARRLNARGCSPGRRIWQRGFHDHALRRAEDLRDTARYIVANPLRAGLVEDIGDYPFWNAVWL